MFRVRSSLAQDLEQTLFRPLNRAFDFFNNRLFRGELPPCLVTLQRKNKAYGYFAGGRFGSKDGAEITDEIALNPSHFRASRHEGGESVRLLRTYPELRLV